MQLLVSKPKVELSRRRLLAGLACLIAAPAIVRAANIMPVKTWYDPITSYNGYLAIRQGNLVCEYGVVDGYLKTSDVMKLDAYLREKWGLVDIKLLADCGTF